MLPVCISLFGLGMIAPALWNPSNVTASGLFAFIFSCDLMPSHLIMLGRLTDVVAAQSSEDAALKRLLGAHGSALATVWWVVGYSAGTQLGGILYEYIGFAAVVRSCAGRDCP
jgi:hypothetical protein